METLANLICFFYLLLFLFMTSILSQQTQTCLSLFLLTKTGIQQKRDTSLLKTIYISFVKVRNLNN